MPSLLKILAALSVIALMAACCKPPTEPIKPDAQKKLPSVPVRFLGVLPDSMGTISLASILVSKADLRLGTTNDSGFVKLDSLRTGDNTLRLTTSTGTVLADTVLSFKLSDTARSPNDTLVIKVPLSQEQAANIVFLLPLAVGNEWTYNFSCAHYEYSANGRQRALYVSYAGTYTIRITGRSLIPARDDGQFTNVVYQTLATRSMTVSPINGQPYQRNDTITTSKVGVFMQYASKNGGPEFPTGKIFTFTIDNKFDYGLGGSLGTTFGMAWDPALLRRNSQISQGAILNNDTLSYRAGSLLVSRAVHNIGCIYSFRWAAPVPGLNTEGSFTLQSYKLVKPTFR